MKNSIENNFLATLIWTVRRSNGMKQKAVAASIGVGEGTYSAMESGKKKPGLDTVRKLADALGVDRWVMARAYCTTYGVEVGDDVNQRMKYARIASLVTTTELSSSVTGVSRTYLYKIETGQSKVSLQALVSVCGFLCVSADWILGIGDVELFIR